MLLTNTTGVVVLCKEVQEKIKLLKNEKIELKIEKIELKKIFFVMSHSKS